MVDGKRSPQSVYNVLIQEYASKLQSSKRCDRLVAVLLSILLGGVLEVFLAPFTWTLWHYGMGCRYTEETLLGYRGVVNVDWHEALVPLLILWTLFYVPIYLALRNYRKRQLWFG